MNKRKGVLVHIENSVPLVFGECKCESGNNSLILMDFIPNRLSPEDGAIYLKCICCSTIYQTKVKSVVY
ncbi:hypothetical protein UFOVP245_157 [uncultured Caudovirales phage]|uniref:Uncharacterized protein n=1 Tax=uncultured Caudovirales phage TaxID=2100421 RepID=A0A6J7WX50_9CAUD|nr:hypothetical protein UFOVP245_157 [uncultured Caudovirales phage]